MGLDTVELVIEIEARFDIVIADEDAGGLVTVGDVYKYVLDKLNRTEADQRCPSAVAFYRLRRALVQGLNVARERIRPDSSSDDLIARRNRKQLWANLAQMLEHPLPELRRPKWMVEAIGLCLAFIFASTLLAMAMSSPVNVDGLLCSALFAAGGTFALGIAAKLLTEPFAIEFTGEADTVRCLVHTFRHLKYMHSASFAGANNDVWESLVDLVAQQASVAHEVMTPDTSFVHDLGMD